MEISYRENLSAIFETMLEKFSFMFCDPVSVEDIHSEETHFLRSSLAFSGPRSGVLSMMVPARLGAVIASNVLGTDPDAEDAVYNAQDAINELINLLVGNLLPELFGKNALFDFGIPESAVLDETEWKKWLADPCVLGFIIDDAPALLYFAIQA
ncbi:MAG: chemotaxis protein CheX [Candidatus Omnitrophota bacterium]